MPQTTRNRLTAAAVGVFFLLVIAVRIAGVVRLAETDPGAARGEVIAGAIAIVLTVVAVAIVFAVFWRISELRRAAVRSFAPTALILNSGRSKDLVGGLRLATGNPQLAVPIGLTLAADSSGLSMWRGGADAAVIESFAWAEVVGLTVGAVRADNGVQVDGLVIRVSKGGASATLPVQVVREGFFPRTISRAYLDQQVEQITHLAGRRGTSAPASRAPSTLVQRRVQLKPGWSAQRIGRIAVVLRVVTSVAAFAMIAVFVVFIVSGIRREDSLPSWMWPFIIAVFVLGALGRLLLFMVKRAGDREKRAGYTTLVGGDLNLPHVDDLTGKVLREAGDPLLTKAQFQLERQRARLSP